MGDFFTYFQSFWPHFWSLIVSGALLGLDDFAQKWNLDKAAIQLSLKKDGTPRVPAMNRLFARITPGVRRRFEVIVIMLAIFYSGYSAWSDEHIARVKAEAALTAYQISHPSVVAAPEMEPTQDPNGLYQYGAEFGSVQGAVVASAQSLVTFQSVRTNGTEDPTKPINYQNWSLSCPALPAQSPNSFTGSYTGAAAGISCTILGRSN